MCVTCATGPGTTIGLVKADSVEIQSKWFELCVFTKAMGKVMCRKMIQGKAVPPSGLPASELFALNLP